MVRFHQGTLHSSIAMIKAVKKVGQLKFDPEDFNGALFQPVHETDAYFDTFGMCANGTWIENEIIEMARKRMKWKLLMQSQILSGLENVPEHSDPINRSMGCLTWLGEPEEDTQKCFLKVDEDELELKVGDVFAFRPNLTHHLYTNCPWTMIVVDFE